MNAILPAPSPSSNISLEALRYWSVELQEPYAGPAAALKRFQEKGLTPK